MQGGAECSGPAPPERAKQERAGTFCRFSLFRELPLEQKPAQGSGEPGGALVVVLAVVTHQLHMVPAAAAAQGCGRGLGALTGIPVHRVFARTLSPSVGEEKAAVGAGLVGGQIVGKALIPVGTPLSIVRFTV